MGKQHCKPTKLRNSKRRRGSGWIKMTRIPENLNQRCGIPKRGGLKKS